MRPTKLTDSAKAAILAWAQALARVPHVKQLAADLGCSQRTVQRWLRQAYLDERRKAAQADVLAQSDVSRGTSGGNIGTHGFGSTTGEQKRR
jgi:transcriptional regulator GlxA family with amidase domain